MKIFVERLPTLVIAGLIYSLFSLSGILNTLSYKTLDFFFLLRGPITTNQEIVIIAVDEASLDALGAWPFPRSRHAELLGVLESASAVAFDFLFSEPTPADTTFNAAMQSSPPVILAAVNKGGEQFVEPVETLNEYFGTGHIEVILGGNGIVRRTNISQQTENGALPAFSLRLLEAAGKKTPRPLNEKSILINHYGPEFSFLHLSYVDVLRGNVSRDFFNDRIVLVGAGALGFGDEHVTPFSKKNQTSGVEIQATILNNLLEGAWLKPLPRVSWLLLAVVALMSFFLWPAQSEKRNLLVNLAAVLLLFVAAIYCFGKTWYIDPAPAVFFLFVAYFVHVVMEKLWTTRRLYSEVSSLDKQLTSQLQKVYTNIPSRFFNLEPASKNIGVRKYLYHLQSGVRVLGIQHHFIEHLLKEELLPLILWDRKSGLVILANDMFSDFWESLTPDGKELPDFSRFHLFIQENALPGKNDMDTVLREGTEQETPFSIDICLHHGAIKKYYRVGMHAVKEHSVDFSGILAVLTDVTEIREAERLKDEVVSIVSHELKLPLTVILGYGEMLADSLEGDKKEYAAHICTQARRLNQLIVDFLDVTRLEHGSRELEKVELNFVTLVAEAVQTAEVPARQKNISIHFDHPSLHAANIIGDYSLLFQAVVNIFDNAVKFSPEHTEITASLTEEDAQLVLSVSDQGPGVPEESRSEIFEKFNRGRKVHQEGGFGLGLSFVSQVLEKHGGNVWLASKQEHGATFCLSLPMAKSR